MMDDDSAGARHDVALLRLLADRAATLGVIGLGYVGLPLAVAFVEAGLSCIGFDIDDDKVAKLGAARSYIHHIDDSVILDMTRSGRFVATSRPEALAAADAIIICVPTPLDGHRTPDLSYVLDTARTIAGVLRPGQLIVLESTSYPGTTSEDVKPILEATGLRSGRDFFLAFSPEREDPANEHFNVNSIPKVVGGDDPGATLLAKLLYEIITPRVVTVGSARVAEAVKLTENIFRSVNIALVNELKTIFDAMDIDVWEVIEAAKTKPFGYMAFYPGPGVGGHCIPVDPFYLSWKSKEFGINARFIELAGEINAAMPNYVLDRLSEALNRRAGIALARSRLLMIGIAYKKNVGDVRESPALILMERLMARGAHVDYHDPLVPVIPRMRHHKPLVGKQGVPWEPERFGDYDAALILTNHDGFAISTLVERSRLIIDTRNATAGIADRSRIVMA